MVRATDEDVPMLSVAPEQEPYNSKRQRSHQICQRLNRTSPMSHRERRQLVQSLVNATFPVFIEPDFRCEYGENIQLGAETFINHNVTINDSAPVIIGRKVLIGPNCNLDTSIKKENNVVFCSPIHIGNNVWIGANVTIVAGVTIGDDAIIGAGCVVDGSVDCGAIVKNNT